MIPCSPREDLATDVTAEPGASGSCGNSTLQAQNTKKAGGGIRLCELVAAAQARHQRSLQLVATIAKLYGMAPPQVDGNELEHLSDNGKTNGLEQLKLALFSSIMLLLTKSTLFYVNLLRSPADDRSLSH